MSEASNSHAGVRMHELEAENASLKARVATAEARLVSAGLAAAPTALPGEADLDRLINMIADKYPELAAREAEGNYRTQFRNSLHAISHMRRGDKLSRDYGLHYFFDQAA